MAYFEIQFNMADECGVLVVLNFLRFFVLLGVCITCYALDVGKDGPSLNVEHALGSGSNLEFMPRGRITIRNIKGTFASYKDDEDFVSDEFINSAKDAALLGNFYHIRVMLIPSESAEETSHYYVSTLIKACALLESNFSDIIKLNLDHTGHVFAVGLSTTKADCSESLANQFDRRTIIGFNTTVILSHVAPGAAPETQGYIRRLEDEKREREKGKGKDNRSFFAKYWMYIVPVVIFLLVSGQEQPAGAGGTGGSGGGGGAPAS